MLLVVSGVLADDALGEEDGFRFAPPRGFVLVEDDIVEQDLLQEIALQLEASDIDAVIDRTRVWLYVRTIGEAEPQVLQVVRIVAELGPAEDESFVRREQASFDRIAETHSAEPVALQRGVLHGGIPYLSGVLKGRGEGSPVTLHSLILPRRDFALSVALFSPASQDGDAVWADVLRGLIVEAPPSKPRKPPLDEERFRRGGWTLLVLLGIYLVYRFCRRRPTGEVEEAPPPTVP